MQRVCFMRRFLLSLALLCAVAAPAHAVSLRDLIDLSKQGLSDDLLIALIDADKSVFHLTAADLKGLKEQGMSDRLLIHLLQTPSLYPVPETRLLRADDRPQTYLSREPDHIVIIDRVETVAVPVYVPVPSHRRGYRRDDDRDRDRDGDRDRADDERRKPHTPPAPVYWGYGGKLRPDAWKPGGR